MQHSAWRLAIKRVVGAEISLTGLLILASPFALIALAIKLDFHTLLSWRRVLDSEVPKR